MFFYSDINKEPFTGRPVPYHEQRATSKWEGHYSNLMYLKFVANSPLSTSLEKRQAAAEIVICERKLEHWRRHPNFSQEEASRIATRLKNQWRMG